MGGGFLGVWLVRITAEFHNDVERDRDLDVEDGKRKSSAN